MKVEEVMQDKNVGKKYKFLGDCFIVRKSVGMFFLEEVETGNGRQGRILLTLAFSSVQLLSRV